VSAAAASAFAATRKLKI